MSDHLPKSPFTTPLELSLVEMVHERCETWKNTLSAVIEYFTMLLEMERYKEKAFRKAAALIGPSNVFGGHDEISSGVNSPSSPASPHPPSNGSPKPNVINTSNTWLVPLQSLAIKGNGESESIMRYMERATMPDLLQLKEGIKSGSKQLKEQLISILSPLHKSYESLNQAMSQHQGLWNSLIEGKDPRSEEGSDPWILQSKLALKVESFLEEKIVFSSGLEGVHNLQKTFDSSWSSAIKGILSEFYIVNSKSTIQFGQQMQDIAGFMEDLTAEQEWSSALGLYRLDFGWSLDTPPFDGFYTSVLGQISHSIYAKSEEEEGDQHVPVKQFSIIKSGFLLKQSSGSFGSKTWNPYFWVLSESGFLHGYLVKEGKTSINIPKATQMLSKKTLQEYNDEAAASLLNKQVIDPSLIDPHVSIWLGNGSVSPAMSESSSSGSSRVDNSGCIFTVISGAISSGGFLFGGKGEKKYVLQSFVEEDMVDWCIAIKQVIQEVESSSYKRHEVPSKPTVKSPDSSSKRKSIQSAHDIIEPQPQFDAAEAQYKYQQTPISPNHMRTFEQLEIQNNATTYQGEEERASEHSRMESPIVRLPPELEKNPWED
jgi:hypothetical protein